MEDHVRQDTVANWVHDVIWGVGGLKDYQHYEGAIFNGCNEVEGELWDHEAALCEAADWVLQCLVNPKFKRALAAVNLRASMKLEEVPDAH